MTRYFAKLLKTLCKYGLITKKTQGQLSVFTYFIRIIESQVSGGEFHSGAHLMEVVDSISHNIVYPLMDNLG